MVGERASAQSPTHSEALKTASSDAQKASAPTPSAAGVTLYFLLGGQRAHSGESHIKREGGGKKAALVTIKCNSDTGKKWEDWVAVQSRSWSGFLRMQAQFLAQLQAFSLNPTLDAVLSQ